MSCETQKAINLELSLVETVEIKAIEEKFGDDQDRKDRLDGFIRKARVLIASHVQLVTEDMGDEPLIESMNESAVGKINLSDHDRGYIGIFYDQKEAGECSAQPHLRLPPLRDSGNHLKRAMSLRLRASSTGSEAEEIHDRDLYFIPDAGKEGNRNALTVNFTSLKKDVRHLHVMYQQESMEARLAKVPATDDAHSCS